MSRKHQAAFRLFPNCVFWFALLGGVDSRADSWGPPREFKTLSENKRFVAHVVPGTEDSKPQLTVSLVGGSKTNELWKTELSNRISPTDAYVSDDGKYVVTLDNYAGVGYGDDVVAIYGQGGQLAKYSLEQIAPLPAEQETGGSIRIRGGYQNRFIHSTSSRGWRRNSIQFFSREATEWMFCLWLDWDERWVAWSMVDGRLLKVGNDQTRRLNVEGRRRALNEATSAEYPAAALNFLGRMRFKEDRHLVEAWLQDAEFSRGSMHSSSDKGTLFAYTARSNKREEADKILSRWDGKDSGKERFDHTYHFLGTLKCNVTFPTAPAKNEGSIRLYLIPEATPLSKWASKRPAQYLIADLHDSYPRVFENGRMRDGTLSKTVDFVISGLTPGKYRLKVVWDRAAPFAKEDEVLCKPETGDFESISSPLISIRKGTITEGVTLECGN